MQHRFVISAADGHEVLAIHFKNDAPHLLIASHGITTEKTEEGIYTQFAENVLPPEFDTVAFDFRGHGDSAMPSLEATVAGEILDFMAVMKWSQEQSYKSICHLGTSFGASITLLSASTYDISILSRVVFWNPVINYRKTFIDATVEWGREYFNQKKVDELAYRSCTPIPETDFLISARMTQELLFMKPESTVWPSDIPLLILHGSADTLVPYEDARDYAEANRPAAKFVGLEDVDHGFDQKLEEAMTMTKDWLMQEVG